MKSILSLLIALSSLCGMSQDLPYHQIPEPPESFSSNNVLSRMIDGLGYRYYWASKDLRPEDLEFKPSEESRTSRETLEHIHGLSEMILNTIRNIPTVRPKSWSELTYDQLRSESLMMIKEASDVARENEISIEEMKVKFKRGESETAFPFWNLLNGPLADAIYHTGQITTLRRASGNPIHPGVSVFMGKTKE